MNSVFLCYPRCSTCAKARRWLLDHSVPFAERNIATENPSADELAEWIAQSGKEARAFFNTSGQVYRALGLKDRLPTMSEAEKITLLATDGMLVKRPLLVRGDTVLVGFKPDEWRSALL